ncbi:hypothetical protein ACWD4O_38780 [Streptomyces sp. NPDC002623]
MGQDATGAASRAFRLLNSEDLRQRPQTAPAERRTTSAVAGAPLDLDLIDYLDQHVHDVITHTRALADDPTPLPRQREGIYDWYVENTTTADEDQQRLRDQRIEQHRLEHAIRLGDYNAIRKEFCPRCGCLGLFWETGSKRAVCSQKRCRTPDGMASRWTLARLAAQKAHRTEIWRRNAT